MTTNLRSLYRAFLRELPPHPLLKGPRSPLHQQLRAEFEAPSSTAKTTSATPVTSTFQGEQYLAYLQAQRTHTMLLERYNPNLAGDMDEAERIRLTARRVGINLPKEFKDGEGEEK